MDTHFLQEILAAIGDGVIAVDRTAKIIFMNQAAEQIMEYGQGAALGQPFETVFRLRNALTGNSLPSPVAQVLYTGKPLGLKNESVMLMNDGRTKYLSATCTPIKQSDGKTSGVVVAFRDVTRFKLLEKRLENEEKNFKSLFQSAPIGMYVVGEKNRIVQVNDEALRMMEKTRAQTLGSSLGEALGCQRSQENIEACGLDEQCQYCEFLRAITLAFEGETVAGIECSKPVMQHGEKNDVWFKVSAAPLVLKEARLVVVALVDITEQKEREFLIAKTRDFYLRLFESFPTVIWRSQITGETEFINGEWYELTGQTLEQSIGYGWLERLHPDDQKKVRRDLQKRTAPQETEIRVLDRNGNYRWLYRISKPYYNLHGVPEGYIGMGIDITDRKRVEEVLNRYRILSEQAQDIILFTDPDGGILEANAAAVKAYGYSRRQLLKSTIFDLCNLDREGLERRRQEIDRQGGICCESIHKRQDGTLFPVEISCQGTKMDGRKVLLNIIRDTSERKRVERELQLAKDKAEAANKTKSEFLANMSHEIRTPINGMVGMIDLTLLRGLPEEQTENLKIAKACAQQLLAIINDILDFSKMEAGKLSLERINFNLKDLVAEVIKAQGCRAEKKGLKVSCTFTANVPEVVCGDQSRLRQILNNLLDNAIKFTDQGAIRLEICRDGDEIHFAVQDTGIGIADDDMSKLFKDFSQVDGSITRKYGGTGLGLAISQHLVELMQGKMRVTSVKDQGSTFYFTLPLPAGKGGVQAKPQETVLVLTPLRLLLVEDDAISRLVTEKILQDMGHSVDSADNGVKALELWQKNSYDVILLDIQMPDMDGIEVTRRLREMEQKGEQRTPIIALTAHALLGDRERFLAAGMDEYIAKPLQIDALRNKLEEVSLPQRPQNELDIQHLQFDDSGNLVVRREAGKERLSLSLQRELVRLLNRAQKQEVEKCAHQMKLLAEQNGLEKLKNAAFKAELAARRGDWREVATHLVQIRKMCVRKEAKDEDTDCGRRSNQ